MTTWEILLAAMTFITSSLKARQWPPATLTRSTPTSGGQAERDANKPARCRAVTASSTAGSSASAGDAAQKAKLDLRRGIAGAEEATCANLRRRKIEAMATPVFAIVGAGEQQAHVGGIALRQALAGHDGTADDNRDRHCPAGQREQATAVEQIFAPAEQLLDEAVAEPG